MKDEYDWLCEELDPYDFSEALMEEIRDHGISIHDIFNAIFDEKPTIAIEYNYWYVLKYVASHYKISFIDPEEAVKMRGSGLMVKVEKIT